MRHRMHRSSREGTASANWPGPPPHAAPSPSPPHSAPPAPHAPPGLLRCWLGMAAKRQGGSTCKHHPARGGASPGMALSRAEMSSDAGRTGAVRPRLASSCLLPPLSSPALLQAAAPAAPAAAGTSWGGELSCRQGAREWTEQRAAAGPHLDAAVAHIAVPAAQPNVLDVGDGAFRVRPYEERRAGAWLPCPDLCGPARQSSVQGK